MLFSILGSVFLPTAPVWANPTGEQVVGGNASFHRDGNQLTINQTTDRLAVNWQTFNIAAGERTHFNMPSATSVALNRVMAGNPSQIYGTLSANGILMLINPSGILVGPGGVINTAGFVGSTLDVNVHEFMTGGTGASLHLAGDSQAAILNQGRITAEKGDVFLIAQKVENRGIVEAPEGTAALVGSGTHTDVVLHEKDGGGFAVRVSQLQGESAVGSNHGLPDGEELLNEGEISAAQAELNASGNIYALAIRNNGTIRAKAVVANADGTVRLDGGLGDVQNTGALIARNAGDDATAAGGKIEVTGQNVTASPESIITAAGGAQGGDGGKVKIDSADTTIVQGKVDVAAPSAGAKGGKVELLGERVGLLDGAKVDASGGAGGGTVLAGGDYLGGRTPSADLKDLAKQEVEPVKNAKAMVMAETAEIKADATVDGDGGKIILWSDEYTGFYGQLFARGGSEGGNGGFVETSSQDNLQAFGFANASATAGQGGLWLVDPRNVSIQTGGTGVLTGGIFTPATDSATIAPSTITTALNGGTSVTINTGVTGTQAGNITVANNVNTAGNPNSDLTLSAANSIIVNSGATIDLGNNAGADLNLLADADADGLGTITTSSAMTAGGTATLQAAGSINLGGVLNAANVNFKGSLVGSTMGIHDTSGSVQISLASLTTYLAATGTVTVGRSDGTGLISIGSSGALNLSNEAYNLTLLGAGSSVNFNNTLTLKNGGTMTVNIGTGNLLSPGSATTDLTIGTTGSLVITSAGQVGAVGVAPAPFLTSVANLQGTTTGLINILDTDNAGLTVNGALSSGNGNIYLTSAGGGTLQNTGTINAGSGVVGLVADNMTLGAAITGNGGIELSPITSNREIDLVDNTGGASALNLSLAEMKLLSSTGTVSLGIANTVGGVICIGNQGDVDLSAQGSFQGYSLELRGNSNVNFNFSAPNNLTIKNGGTLTVAIGAGQLLSPGDTSIDLAAVSGGSVNLKVTSASGIGLASAPFTTQLGSGAFSAPSTGGVGTVFLANTGDFLVNAPVFTSNGNYNVTTSGTFINTTAGTINAGLGTINITSGGLSIGGNMLAANVNLTPITAGLGIGLNDAAKAFNISATGLQNLILPSSATLTFGSAAGIAPISIGTDGAIDLTANSYNLTLQTLSGGVVFNNQLQLSGGKTLNFNLGTGSITSNQSPGALDVVLGDLASGGGILRFQSANNVTLSTATENLGASVLAGSLTLKNSRALNLTGALTVGTTAAITVGGTLQSSEILTVPGAFTVGLTTPVSDILLTGNNVLGTSFGVSSGLTNLRDLSLKNTVNKNPGGADNFLGDLSAASGLRDLTLNFTTAAVQLNGNRLPTVNRNLSVSSFGDLTQAGKALVVLGTSEFTVQDAAATITLNGFANDLRGAVSLTTNPGTSLQNIDLWANNSTAPGLMLGTVTAGGDPVTGGGNFRLRTGSVASSSSGTLTQTGNLLLGSGGLYLSFDGASGARYTVTLGSAGNNFSGQVQVDAGQSLVQNLTYANLNTAARMPLLDGLSNLADLSITFSGVSNLLVPNLQAGFGALKNLAFVASSLNATITQASGGVNTAIANGTATFTTGDSLSPGGSITLGDAANNFGGAVSLTTNGGDAFLRESSGLVFGTIDLGGGNLTVDVLAGATSQTGSITASEMSLTAAGNVALANNNNISKLAASLTGSGGFAFNNAQSFEITAVNSLSGIRTASGNVTVTTSATGASGDITVSQGIFAGGNGSVVLNAQYPGTVDPLTGAPVLPAATLSLNADVNTAGTGSLTLQSAGDLTTGGSVKLGTTTLGAIRLVADGDQTGPTYDKTTFALINNGGVLTVGANTVVGNVSNSSDYELLGGDIVIDGLVFQTGSSAKVVLSPSAPTGTIQLGSGGGTNPTTGDPYGVCGIDSGDLANIRSSGTVQIGGSALVGGNVPISSTASVFGAIFMGNLNLTGNSFGLLRLRTDPGGLTQVNDPSSSVPAGTYSISSSSLSLELDTPIELNGNILGLSTTGGLSSAGADISILRPINGGLDPTTGLLLRGGLIVSGGTAGDVLVDGSVGLSTRLALISISGNNITANTLKTSGGSISLTTTDGKILLNGEANSSQQEVGTLASPNSSGTITFNVTGTGSIETYGAIDTRGRQGVNIVLITPGGATTIITQSGGSAGDVTLQAPEGNITVGSKIFAYGGNAVVDSLDRGESGTITIGAKNIAITQDQVGYYSTKFDINAQNNLIFAAVPNFTQPEESVGGTSIRMNQLEGGVVRPNDPVTRQDLSLVYGSTTTDGELYMGAGSTIVTAGGSFNAVRGKAPDPGVGGMTLGDIYTTGRGINSGSVLLGKAETKAPVTVSYINTTGGESTSDDTSAQDGLAGGNITVVGSEVRIGQILSSGSSPLDTAIIPAKGGNGGAISVSGDKISILGNLTTTGGAGNGATGVRSNGGAGGQITLTSTSTEGLVLDSLNLTTPTFVFDSSGGDGFNGANPGSAGRINLLGPISAAFGGVASQANTASTILTLQFTGLPPVSTVPLVKLGRDSGDLISLGTLVAGVDNDFTSGTVAINGRLSLANLNTVARRYNLEINGGGTISGLFTPLNTGYLKVGNAALETSFTGGLNGLTGPYEARLLGTISAPADSEGIVLGKIVLSGDTVLNTAGSVLALGTIDSETATPRNLDLNSASGDTTVSGAVGSALTLGSVHILSTGSTTFGSTVLANRMTTDAGSDVTFNENLTLTLSDVLNPSRFLGGVTFDNVAFSQGLSDDSLLVSGAGGKEFNQAVQLSNGPIEFGGSGQYTFAGDVSLATTSGLPVSMLLSGTSAKNFQGDVMVNEINQSLLSGKVTFQGDVTTSAMGTASSGASTFNSDVELAGITFTAGGATTFNTLTLSTGPVEFAGGDPASYLVKGLLTGGNQDLTISTTGGATFQAAANGIKSLTLAAGKGTTIFQGALGAATIEQVAGKGIVSFSENVNTTGDSDFQAGVVMGGNMIFTTGTGGKTTTFAATSTPSLNGNLTFAGAGDVIFNPALTGGNNVLTLSGLGARTFNSTVTAGSVVQDDGAGLLTFNKNVTANSVADPSELWNVALNAMTLGSKGSVQILGDVKSVGTVVLDAVNGITLGAGNNLLSEANSVFTLGGGDITMAADVSLNGAGNYVLSSKISDQGGGFSLLLAAGGSKTFNGDVTIQSMGQDDLSGTATFAGNVALVGNGQMDGNVILNGTGKTFASTGGSLAFGNAGTDTLTIQKSATLKTDAGQTLVVNGKIQMNGQLDLETGAAFLNQIAGTSSNLSLKLDDVDLAGTVALGSGSMTVKTLSAIPMSLGDNPLGLNLSKTELGLISTSAGVSVNDESGGGIFIDNLQLPDVQGITGPLRFISPNGVVAVMTPSVLRKLGVEAQDLVGLNNASFNEIAQLNLSAPSADVDINVAGGMAVTGSVDITGKAFLLTTAGRISASAPINAQRVEMTSAKSLSASGPLTAEDGVVLVSGSSLTTGKVNAGAGLVTMTGSGNVTINGAVSSLAGVTINPQGGYFINNAGGNVFDNATLAGGVRVVTKDIFSPNLSVGYANGLQVVYGVSDPALLAKNQIGVMDNFTDGNFAPLYFQFTTGTDQPYIFAQQTAIPLVRFPPSLSFAGGFRQAPRYSPEDLELLTPEERSAYEAAERQKSAKVMLQGNVGVQEVGRSSQSQPTSPQASRENAEEAGKKPTARVWLQGQPLARSQTDADRQDTTRLLKANHSRAVALRPPSVQGEDDILFGERISAEIGVVSLPVASQQ